MTGAASNARRLRVLHVSPTYLPAVRYGGPIRSVHGLCRALAARGHEVHVFTTNVDGAGVSPVATRTAVDVDGVNVWYFETALGRRLYRSPALGAALAERVAGFDILHLHSVFLWPTAVAARAARSAGRPYILCPRGMLVPELVAKKSRALKTAWLSLIERANLANAAALHFTARLEADDYSRMRLPARPFAVVPNGVELPAAPPAATRRAGPPRVLSLGRLSWKKGLDRLIAAMADVPGAELVIAGNDEENLQPALRTLASELGLSKRIAFAGPVHGRDKWALLADCDLFAMPSHSENFGIAALEAMACGRPVLLTPCVGLAETAGAAGAAAVVENEPKALGAEIRALLADPRRRERMGEAGRRLALGSFSWPAIAADMEQTYLRYATP